MKDKDIMDIEVYQIKSNKWQIIKEEKNNTRCFSLFFIYFEMKIGRN